jgi:protoporphyrinogen oxidase
LTLDVHSHPRLADVLRASSDFFLRAEEHVTHFVPAGLVKGDSTVATALREIASRGHTVGCHGSTSHGRRGSEENVAPARADLGSHIFIPHDPRVASLWSELIGSDYRLVKLRRGIWSQGRIFEYPMEPVDVLRNLGVIQTSLCALSLLATKAPWRRPSDDSAESWIVTRFGRQLFRLFFEDFGKKLFGLPCAEIDPSFAIGLLGNLDRLSPADHFRKRLVQAGGRARVSGGGGTRVSDAPRFQHPRQGMGVFCSKLAEGLERRGGSVYLSTRVERLLVAEGRVEGLQIRGAPKGMTGSCHRCRYLSWSGRSRMCRRG